MLGPDWLDKLQTWGLEPSEDLSRNYVKYSKLFTCIGNLESSRLAYWTSLQFRSIQTEDILTEVKDWSQNKEDWQMAESTGSLTRSIDWRFVSVLDLTSLDTDNEEKTTCLYTSFKEHSTCLYKCIRVQSWLVNKGF